MYLHGLPYSFAPAVQTHVPMIGWLSDSLMSANGMESVCPPSLVTGKYSHDNLFDTVLGMMDVRTSIYRRERDMFASCRAPKFGP